ncbi:tRNA pseudouridine synthase 3, partial [Halocaridina rubra]
MASSECEAPLRANKKIKLGTSNNLGFNSIDDINMESVDTAACDDEEKVRARKKLRGVPVSQLSREELEARVTQLEAHNKQLLNLLAKSQGIEKSKLQSSKKPRKERSFDFTKHSRRHVLLKFLYLGWDYHGFAVQEDTQQTIEAHLFAALLKTRLIESRETSNYH